MKGKQTFTEKEAQKIRALIEQKQTADRARQKRLRHDIRKLGFYITDFSNKKKYTVEDFERYATIIN